MVQARFCPVQPLRVGFNKEEVTGLGEGVIIEGPRGQNLGQPWLQGV
jgi:hypothetical protein